MNLQLQGRTALVTGASMGIGNAVAQALAQEGVKLAVVARRQPLLDALSATIAQEGNPAPSIIAADIMEPQSIERIGAEAERALGHVDILVNCAGGSRPFGVDATEDQWEEAMTLNFARLRQLTHRVLPGMMKRNWGRVINITGKSEPERLNGANAAKAAVHMWSKGLSREVGKSGITINSIAPGFIVSEQIKEKFPPEELKRLSTEAIPAGHIGDPSDIANAVLFIASPLARYITGTIIPIDGGLRRYAF